MHMASARKQAQGRRRTPVADHGEVVGPGAALEQRDGVAGGLERVDGREQGAVGAPVGAQREGAADPALGEGLAHPGHDGPVLHGRQSLPSRVYLARPLPCNAYTNADALWHLLCLTMSKGHPSSIFTRCSVQENTTLRLHWVTTRVWLPISAQMFITI